jgi:hypothetical protein
MAARKAKAEASNEKKSSKSGKKVSHFQMDLIITIFIEEAQFELQVVF